MKDAQIGLLIATLLILGLAALLHRRGALSSAGFIAVFVMSVASAATLFLSQ